MTNTSGRQKCLPLVRCVIHSRIKIRIMIKIMILILILILLLPEP
jgi:hypothetical protein